jgi:hypothetical protein
MQYLICVTLGIALGCSPLRNSKLVDILILLTGG